MAVPRWVLVLSLSACVSAIVGPPGNGTKSVQKPVQKTDTYLDAYSKSRIEAEKAKQGVVIITAKDGEKQISNRDDSYQTGYDYSPPFQTSESFSNSGYSSGVSNAYLPPSSYNNPVKFETTYNAPPNNYGPPAQTYGLPSNNYGPPANSYGPPQQSYGPPVNRPLAPVYGPPIRPSYGVPYSTGLGFLDKLKLKLDILTIAKLLLKFMIFKKIVTMLGVVCMLLVIPKIIEFKKTGSGDSNYNDDYKRNFVDSQEVRLTSVQDVLDRAMSVYGSQNAECGLTCRVQRVLDDVYEFQPYFITDSGTQRSLV